MVVRATLLAIALCTCCAWVAPVPVSLRTEFNPPGAVAAGCQPATDGLALQWANAHPAPPNDQGVLQLAYEVQLLAGVSPSPAPPLWGCGKVASAAQSLVVQPADVVLPTTSTLYWQVRVWLAAADPAAASDPSAWTTPLAFDTAPAAASWSAVSWVGGHNQLRAAFPVAPAATASPVKRARAYAAGMGAFYLWVNGQPVSDSVMDPPQSVYPLRTLHASYDVTALLRPGAINVVGAQLGNYKWGYDDVWCNMTASGGADGCRALALQLVVEYEDAAAVPDTVLTTFAGAGSPWVGRQGPVSWDHLFHGETFDARLDVPGWASTPDLADLAGGAAAWQPVEVVTPAGTGGSGAPTGPSGPGTPAGPAGTGFGPLVPTNMPPLRATETLAPVALWSVPRPGYGDWGATRALVFDFGKNSAGMVTLRLSAAEVTALAARGVKSLQIEHAEITHAVHADTWNTYCRANVPAGGDVHLEPCQVPFMTLLQIRQAYPAHILTYPS
jgi:alpha-L-rhamnosidase